MGKWTHPKHTRGVSKVRCERARESESPSVLLRCDDQSEVYSLRPKIIVLIVSASVYTNGCPWCHGVTWGVCGRKPRCR